MANIIISWPIWDILTVFNQPLSFKSIGDAQQAIKGHSGTANSSFSVYKILTQKVTFMVFIKALHIGKDKFKYINFKFVIYVF